MAKCDYFNVETKKTVTKEMRQDRQQPALNDMRWPWCSHPKHPRVDLKTAHTFGGPKLQCEGELDNCPLTEDEFTDT